MVGSYNCRSVGKRCMRRGLGSSCKLVTSSSVHPRRLISPQSLGEHKVSDLELLFTLVNPEIPSYITVQSITTYISIH
jgi:hypothetical protein